MLRSHPLYEAANTDNLLLLLPPDPRWRPRNIGAPVVFSPPILLGRADARSPAKSGEKNTGIPHTNSIVVREQKKRKKGEKKGKKGKKEGKKKKKRGGALGRARTTDQLVYPDFTVRMRSYWALFIGEKRKLWPIYCLRFWVDFGHFFWKCRFLLFFRLKSGLGGWEGITLLTTWFYFIE